MFDILGAYPAGRRRPDATKHPLAGTDYARRVSYELFELQARTHGIANMRRSIFQSAAALLSVVALGAAAGTPQAGAASVASPVLDAVAAPQPGFPAVPSAFSDGKGEISDADSTAGLDEYAVEPSTVGSGIDGFAGTNYQNADLSLDSRALDSPAGALGSGSTLPSFSAATPGEVTVVPLPAVGWLLGAGLLGLIAVARPARLPGRSTAEHLPQASHVVAETAHAVVAAHAVVERTQGEGARTRDRNKASEYRWYGVYSSWPGELC